MSDDWQVGDLALCVAGGIKTREGCTYTVIRVHVPKTWLDGLFNPHDCPLLDFAEFGINDEGAKSARFRKIRPDEPKACEEEFKILLQLSKKRVSA